MTVCECPLIVFVNSRSGGKHGSDLTLAFQRNIGRLQVKGGGASEADTSSQCCKSISGRGNLALVSWGNVGGLKVMGCEGLYLYYKVCKRACMWPSEQ